MKVYVLTTGDYSDYTIRGIFSTKKAAEDAADAMKIFPEGCYSGVNPIAEFEVDSYNPFERCLSLFYQPSTGKITKVYYEGYLSEERIVGNKDEVFMIIRYSERFRDRDVLEKAVRDKYMKWKAEQEGIV